MLSGSGVVAGRGTIAEKGDVYEGLGYYRGDWWASGRGDCKVLFFGDLNMMLVFVRKRVEDLSGDGDGHGEDGGSPKKKKETNPDPNYSKTSAMPLQVPSS